MCPRRECPREGLDNSARLTWKVHYFLGLGPGKSNLLRVKPHRYFQVLVFFCVFCFIPAVGAWAVDYWTPYVTKLTTDSATVNWRGDDNGSGLVEFATSSYYDEHQKFNEKVESPERGYYQHVPLTGLEPDTSYIYRVRPSDNPDVFSNRTFRTMPVTGPFTFIVISDTHAQEKRFKYVADAIAGNETDVLFILDGGDYASWDYEAYWADYFHYADGMLSKFPLFTTIGNHEYHNYDHPEGPPTDADHYHKAYDVAADGPLNYAFDCSDIRFVVLNSPDPNNANGDDPQPSLPLAASQASWLADQLDNKLAGTFTIHHHPIWDYGRKTLEPALQPWQTLYQTYNISANFAGHTHNYQRYSVKGIPYFVVGNGGGKFSDIMEGYPHAKWYQYGDTRQLGYLKVSVDPANNTATAQEIFVAYVDEDDSENATIYNPPIIADTITFPLVSKLSTLTVTKSGLGSGTVVSIPSDIDCGPTCEAQYKQPERVVLTPIADNGSVFAGWTGACKGQGGCSVVMRRDLTVGAVFEKGCSYSMSPSKKTLTYKGGKVTVKVTATGPTFCPAPEVINNTDWITSTISAFTENKGSVKLSIPKYTGSAERSADLFIGGNTFTVTQTGQP